MVVIRYGLVLKEVRIIIGVAIGLYTGIAIMYALSGAEHKRMHDLLKQHGIEVHEH